MAKLTACGMLRKKQRMATGSSCSSSSSKQQQQSVDGACLRRKRSLSADAFHVRPKSMSVLDTQGFLSAAYRGARTRDRVVQSALATFDDICRDISARCSGLTADRFCGGPIVLPRRWRLDCDERSVGASKENISPEPLFVALPGNPSTKGGQESPAEMVRFPENASSSSTATESHFDSSGICGVHAPPPPPVDVVPVLQGNGRQQDEDEAQEHGQARWQAAEQATIACARNVAASAAIDRGGVDGLGDGGDCCSNAAVLTRMQTNGGCIGTPAARSPAGLAISATGKAPPEQHPHIRPLTTGIQQGGKMVGLGLDCAFGRGGPEPVEPAVRLGGGSTVDRTASLGIGGPDSQYAAAEGTTVMVESDLETRTNEDGRLFVTLVGGRGNRNAAGNESNTNTLLPPPVEAGGEDEADDLTYSDLEDDSLTAAPEHDTAVVCEPIISCSSSSSSATAGKGGPEVEASKKSDKGSHEALGNVDVDVGDRRESHDLKSASPCGVSPRAAGSEGGELPCQSGFRVREEDEINFVRPASGDICGDEMVSVAGACEAAAKTGDCPPGGLVSRGETFGGVGAAATAPVLTTEDGRGDSLGGVPHRSCSPARGGGGSGGAERASFAGPLSWSVGSSFEATPLRGEIISDVFAADSAAASLTGPADPDDVVLAARALLGGAPSEADRSKTRVNSLGWRARETVGIPCDIGRSGGERPAGVSVARSHERQLERASPAPEGSFQRTRTESLSSRPGGVPVETGKSPRSVLDTLPERDARGLVADGIRHEEQWQSTAIIDGILSREARNVADMSTRELEEELMWIRAVLASRTHL